MVICAAIHGDGLEVLCRGGGGLWRIPRVRRTDLLPRGERNVQQCREWNEDKKENGDAHQNAPKGYVLLYETRSCGGQMPCSPKSGLQVTDAVITGGGYSGAFVL